MLSNRLVLNECKLRKLKKIDDLSEFIVNIYSSAAQYNEPPRYPVKLMCDAIDGAPDGTDVLGRILAGIQSLVGSDGNRGCYDLRGYSDYLTESWDWQTCTEMVIPIGGSDNITIVREKPFNMKERNKQCKRHYGVVPRPHWVTTYYGGYDIKMVLRKFGSNIIFSNGLRDPWSRAGVLENLSDGLLAVYTIEGSHCLDLNPASEIDTPWLTEQREKEIEIMETWLANYYAYLK